MVSLLVASLAPARTAFAISPVVLHPPPDGDAVRAMWFYAGTLFDTTTSAQPVLDLCAREGINRLYCGGYSVWTNGTSTQKANMRSFLQAAHASGIRVEAEFGDTDWQEDAAKVRMKIDQILALHNATPTNSADNFDALHFDVEFWVDPSWTAAGTETARRLIAVNYLDNCLVNGREHLDSNGAASVDIGVDLSAHLENSDKLPTPFLYAGTTQSFLGHVFDLADDVVIMSYIDSAGSLYTWTSFELGVAIGKSRTIQLAAEIEPAPPANPINTFADNAPSGYVDMLWELEQFHASLSPAQRAALDGFAVFQYNGYGVEAPAPHNRADLDGDEDVDAADYSKLAGYLAGPAALASGLPRDGDFNEDAAVDLADFALFCRCYTGAGITSPIAAGCAR
jgi:hypothetical protein